MKKLLIILTILIISTSCADSKYFKVKNEFGETETILVKPYGFANMNDKIEGIEYEPSIGNIVLDVLFLETIVVPIYLIGWQYYEPVGLETENYKIVDGKIIKNEK